MEVKYFIWPEDSIEAVSSFANVIDMIEFFSQANRYGQYPFINDKYGMVAVYPFQWGGMEHETMTTIHRSWVLYGDDSGISHELSHMWWGDMVTCQDWRNIWLNEGFATYSDALYDEHRHGHSSFINTMNDQKPRAILLKTNPNAFPSITLPSQTSLPGEPSIAKALGFSICSGI